MEEIVENNNFVNDGTSFSFSEEDSFEFGGKGKARRAERQTAKSERKAARTDKKLSKSELRRSRGEAKIIAAQTGTKTGIGAAIGGVLGGVAKAVMPGSSSEEPAASETASSETTDVSSAAKTAASPSTDAPSEGGMSKKMKMGIYIGGGVLLVGVLAFIFLRPKKAA